MQQNKMIVWVLAQRLPNIKTKKDQH